MAKFSISSCVFSVYVLMDLCVVCLDVCSFALVCLWGFVYLSEGSQVRQNGVRTPALALAA